MLSFTGSVRVFVALEPCDMRKGFEGLAGLVGTVMKEQLQSGALFVFGKRRRTRLKMLYFDGTGAVALEQAVGGGNLFVAAGHGGQEDVAVAAGSVGHADRRGGFARGEAAAVV